MFPPPDSDDSTSKADLFGKTHQARKAVRDTFGKRLIPLFQLGFFCFFFICCLSFHLSESWFLSGPFQRATEPPGKPARLCVAGDSGTHLAEREGGRGGCLRLERPQQRHLQEKRIPHGKVGAAPPSGFSSGFLARRHGCSVCHPGADEGAGRKGGRV